LTTVSESTNALKISGLGGTPIPNTSHAIPVIKAGRPIGSYTKPNDFGANILAINRNNTRNFPVTFVLAFTFASWM
jgi:hypothetical protein